MHTKKLRGSHLSAPPCCVDGSIRLLSLLPLQAQIWPQPLTSLLKNRALDLALSLLKNARSGSCFERGAASSRAVNATKSTPALAAEGLLIVDHVFRKKPARSFLAECRRKTASHPQYFLAA